MGEMEWVVGHHRKLRVDLPDSPRTRASPIPTPSMKSGRSSRDRDEVRQAETTGMHMGVGTSACWSRPV